MILPEIHSMGISIWDPIWAKREHIGPHSELVHILESEVILHLKGKKYKGKKGDTLIVPEQTPHRDEFPLGSEFRVLHMQFTWKDFNSYFGDNCNRGLLRISKSDKQTINEMMHTTFSTFRKDPPLAREMIESQLLTLLLFISSAIRTDEKPRPKKDTGSDKRGDLIEEAKAFIREHINEPVSLGTIAKHLKLSEYYLSHLFSEETGFTLWSYLTHLRMEKAGELLQDPTIRVSEVAYQVGYEDPNYFTKAFKKHHNVSPGKFRRRGHC
jgi:AraC-like DNA-binding protein